MTFGAGHRPDHPPIHVSINPSTDQIFIGRFFMLDVRLSLGKKDDIRSPAGGFAKTPALGSGPQRYFLSLDSSVCLSRQDHSLGVAWDSPAL